MTGFSVGSRVETRDEWVAGSVEQARDKLGKLAEVGVDRVMLQHQDHTDIAMVEKLRELL
jgi:hypothetical protein